MPVSVPEVEARSYVKKKKNQYVGVQIHLI